MANASGTERTRCRSRLPSVVAPGSVASQRASQQISPVPAGPGSRFTSTPSGDSRTTSMTGSPRNTSMRSRLTLKRCSPVLV